MAIRGAVFGSCQERKMFPMFHEPSRLGIEMTCLDATHRGPGSYDNHEFRTIMYDIQKKPESKKGYVISARTAARFPSCHKTTTPSPQKYQQDQTLSKVLPPCKTPFNSTTQRFKSKAEAVSSPGPGAYSHDTISNRKVSWPMSFGSPDWDKLPQMEKRAVRMQLNCDKEFLKHRNRMAYLSLFYS